MKKYFIFLLSFILVFSGCNPVDNTDNVDDSAESESEESTENEVKVANPASVHCEKEGGTLEIVDTDEGQVGMCTLPDGTECEEWAYFRGECPVDEDAVENIVGFRIEEKHQKCVRDEDCRIFITDCGQCDYPGKPVHQKYVDMYESIYESRCASYKGDICDMEVQDYELSCKDRICVVEIKEPEVDGRVGGGPA